MAKSFNPSFLLSDKEMFDYKSMGWSDIQNFLNGQPGILKNLIIADYKGRQMEASAIIYLAAKEHKINPKVILAKLQHEASLITKPNPKDSLLTWATGYAVCDSCYVGDPRISIFGGFGQQVDYLARILRKYTDKPELYNYQVGDTHTFGTKRKVSNIYPPYNKKTVLTKVTFANIATKNLYTYTPHVYTYFYKDDETGEIVYVGGNYNFWRIWNQWFGQTAIYPDGSLLQLREDEPLATKEEKQVVWLIRDGKRRAFQSKTALITSYDIRKIIFSNKEELEKYEIGQPIKYPNYSLLRDPEQKIYLIVDDKKRLIATDEVFKKIGFHPEEVIDIETTDLNLYQDGSPITQYSIYPTGALLQNEDTGAIFYVESSLKQPIVDKKILELNFSRKKILSVKPGELSRYLTGAPVQVENGNIIKSEDDPTVYVISNGKRRHIPSEKIFNQLGYDWDNIITVPQTVVDIHPLGDPIGE